MKRQYRFDKEGLGGYRDELPPGYEEAVAMLDAVVPLDDPYWLTDFHSYAGIKGVGMVYDLYFGTIGIHRRYILVEKKDGE